MHAMTRGRRVRRTIRRLIALVIVAAGVATASYALAHTSPAKQAAAVKVFKTAAITSGSLTTSEKIDGSLLLSASTNVLHRIEGQTSSSTTGAATPAASTATPAASTGNGSTAAAAGASTGNVTQSVSDARPDDCQTPPTSAATPPGSAPADSTPAGPTTTTTVPAPATTSATPPTDCSTTTTAPATDATGGAGATSTTVPSGARGGSGAPSGGGRTASTPSGAGSGSGSGGASSAASSTRVTQTVTSVTHVGAKVGLGDVLYTVDSAPVVALSGALPAWRTLKKGVTAGPDVQQLERSLVSMGYDPSGTVTVDNTFDAKTTLMVERWQDGLGEKKTGIVTLGSVVFLPSSTTVTTVSAVVGQAVSDGDTIVALAAATKQVVITVPNGDEAHITPGLQVTLGDTTGTVSLLRSAVHNGTVVVEAVITPSADIAGANGATVKVGVSFADLTGVLIAPADALLSRLDGTYAVEVQTADGAVTWHTVDLLGISGAKVGIRGDGLTAGMLVLEPA